MKHAKFLLIASLMGIALAGCTNNSTESSDISKETSEQASSSSVMETATSSSAVSSSTSTESTTTTTSSEEQTIITGLSEAAILNSDYSSLNGTWTNSNGYQLTFNNSSVTLSGEGLGGVTEFSLSNPQKQNNVIFLSFEPAPAPNGMSLMIASKGTTPEGIEADGTDSNYDRIMMGNNGGTLLFAPKENGGIPDTAYYREK
ncbi:DUF6287 domain-containing protein [Enterococcus pallens]|uniref:DUF6287 domain-containing protein n=1 Tax=Enterococcus pallens ATCC BAA-351 TaxID=1158607 RepID=R2SBZ6_9ENTE|nr:DUF6287 domain-containing protein [Enterococcus pallens]EOH93040.1 hypothetical protein UAU_02682 [Enterococcus pallens ATCC BAA-351]EOU24826.1 hypothetical protein I588_00813 [Enterococcus pallens ATCC BAA-351]OJG76274.1 hypothetical protein RV10_GL003880 [Enterococcus pallens]